MLEILGREFNAPEFLDKAIFRNFIDTLTNTGRAELRDDGRIHFGDELKKMSSEARYVLPADVRQTILHMARSEAPPHAHSGAVA